MSESKQRRTRCCGVTGSRDGITKPQGEALLSLLSRMIEMDGISELHHGDCVGADMSAHDVGRMLKLRIVTHPPKKDILRGFAESDAARKPRGYLHRNQEIVNECAWLIVLPGGFKELRRSGTWSTCRIGRARDDTFVAVIWPNGKIDYG